MVKKEEKVRPLHFEIKIGDDLILCDYYLSGMATIFFDNYFNENLPTLPKDHNNIKEQTEHRAATLLYANKAIGEFLNGLPEAVKNGVIQQYRTAIQIAKIDLSEQQLELEGSIITFPKYTKKEAIESLGAFTKKQVEERFDNLYVGGDRLHSLYRFYNRFISYWLDAERFYKKNSKEPLVLNWIQQKYPFLPDDLIAWLSFGKNQMLSRNDFPTLLDSDWERLNIKLADGYRLSSAKTIIYEHASRMCNNPPYSFALQYLKNTVSIQKRTMKT